MLSRWPMFCCSMRSFHWTSCGLPDHPIQLTICCLIRSRIVVLIWMLWRSMGRRQVSQIVAMGSLLSFDCPVVNPLIGVRTESGPSICEDRHVEATRSRFRIYSRPVPGGELRPVNGDAESCGWNPGWTRRGAC